MVVDASVQTLAKAGALIAQLESHDDLTATQLAELVAEPRSSVYRLLATLRQMGWVEAGETRGSFRLGLRFLSLSAAVQRRLDSRRAALRTMQRLHAATGETVFLMMRRDDVAVCIERLEGRRVQVLAVALGGALPLHAGAGPRALLAWQSDEFWGEYRSRGMESLTPATITDPEVLRTDLDQTRRRGYAVSDGDVTVGIAALGVPIFDHTGTVCSALSISGVRPAILGPEARDLPRMLLECGREISAAMGAAPPYDIHARAL
jgi:DNA-binding IclR family transcriptional regulator